MSVNLKCLPERGDVIAIRNAADAYRRAALVKPDNAVLHYQRGKLLFKAGKRQLATRILQIAVELEYVAMGLSLNGHEWSCCHRPRNAKFGFWLAIASGKSVARPPAEYIINLYRGYARNFEAHLTEKLHYQTPFRMRSLVETCCAGIDEPARQFKSHLDLGCGTGLCVKAFEGLVAGPTVGVDLSPDMVRRSAGTNADESADFAKKSH